MNRLFRPIYHLFLILVLFTISFCIGISQITPIYAATGINQVINFQGKVVKVYRDNLEMATLEVIQVRRDISAADIRDLKGKIQIGDQIR
jgi:hypothetical protein